MTTQAIPFTQVQITDAFWAPRREANRKLSLPLSLNKLAEAGNLRNLELAAAGATEGFVGPVFADSDIYKALEEKETNVLGWQDVATAHAVIEKFKGRHA